MENANSNEATQTSTEVIDTIQKVSVPACILLLFSEYLGYESQLLEWCEEWCQKPNFPDYKKNILFVDAKSILKKMHQDYSEKELHNWWSTFYNVAIKSWSDKLQLSDPSYIIEI